MKDEQPKLELRHLCPYLPYSLEFITDKGKWILDSLEKGGWTVDGRKAMYIEKIALPSVKPLLIPLSEFNDSSADEEIYQKFSYYISTKVDFFNLRDTTYGIVEILCKYHFDVFNLIDNNLALNKLTHEK